MRWATSPGSVKLQRHRAPGALSRQSRRSARPSGMPTMTAQAPVSASDVRQGRPRVASPARARTPRPGRASSARAGGRSSSVQPEVSVRTVLGVADGVVGALGVGGELHQPRLAVGRPGAHGQAVAAHRRAPR